MSVIKDNWLKVDECCPNCGQVTKRQKGITKQNIKRLVKPKLDMTEFIITFMLIMVIFLAFMYKAEVGQCHDWLNPMFENHGENCNFICSSRCSQIQAGQFGGTDINLSNWTWDNSTMKDTTTTDKIMIINS
jgi:hypothetical protein